MTIPNRMREAADLLDYYAQDKDVWPSEHAQLLREDADTIERVIAEMELRLEITPDHPYDGIACRDQTIELLEIRSEMYEELVMAVATKYPNETRHETALRYIRNAESGAHGPSQAIDQERGK